MPSALKEHVLVLNASWMPICVTTVRQALIMVYKKNASVVCPHTYELYNFDTWIIQPSNGQSYVRTATHKIKIPSTIKLTTYSKIPPRTIPFTRRNLLKRDDATCQYCGESPRKSKLSVDHIIPRSRGGHTNWSNCVIACKKCNARKGSRMLYETNMKLIRKPFAPRFGKFFPGVNFNPHWKRFLTVYE